MEFRDRYIELHKNELQNIICLFIISQAAPDKVVKGGLIAIHHKIKSRGIAPKSPFNQGPIR
jgi:hypothetical protein